jgi:hypothetical protein
VHEWVPDGRWLALNRAAGATLNVVLAACLAWFVAALVLIVPSDSPALTAVRTSAILGSLVEARPPEGRVGVVVLRSGLVPGVNGPLVLAEPVSLAAAKAPSVLAARASVLQVRSTACDKELAGTGWVAGPGVILTNAHVVAGSRRSFLAGGPGYDGAPATVTAFDPVDDIAALVLDDPGVPLPPVLPLVARVQHGESGAVIGFPQGGEQQVIPARIDRVASYDVEPLGGGAPVAAPVLALRAAVEPGDSGGPILSLDGSVLGMVVAKGIGQRVDAAYGVASSDLLRAVADGARRVPVSAGACLTDAEYTTPAGSIR